MVRYFQYSFFFFSYKQVSDSPILYVLTSPAYYAVRVRLFSIPLEILMLSQLRCFNIFFACIIFLI